MPSSSTKGATAFPGSLEIEGVVCYPDDRRVETWLYVPGSPRSEQVRGRSTLQLWTTDQGGMLQIGAEWTVSPDVLAHLHDVLSTHAGSNVQLELAPSIVQQVTLQIGDGEGALDVAASSSSSGFPPYRAIFRLDVNAAQRDAVVAALNGGPGHLVVRYHASAALPVAARAALAGDITTASDTLTGASSPAEIRTWITSAIASRQLALTEESAGPATNAVKLKARELAVDTFVTLLAAKVAQPSLVADASQGPRSVFLRAEGVASEIVQQPMERLTDVSTWFATGACARHITRVAAGPGSGPAPPGHEVMVALSCSGMDLPVAFVEARCGDARAVLRPPAFAAVRLDAARCDAGITITTHYTTGAAPYQSRVAVAEAARLAPIALGLSEISVDARARQQAGARAIRVRVQFRPSGEGNAEDRTFYLRDETWVASFFIVTRGAPATGECDVEWKETTAAGPSRRHRLVVEDQTAIVLQETEPETGGQ